MDAAKKRKAQFGDAPVLGQGCTELSVVSWFGSARQLEKGVHGCVAPGLCEGAPDGETKGERSVCATTWHGFLGDSGESPPIMQVCMV